MGGFLVLYLYLYKFVVTILFVFLDSYHKDKLII